MCYREAPRLSCWTVSIDVPLRPSEYPIMRTSIMVEAFSEDHAVMQARESLIKAGHKEEELTVIGARSFR